MLHALGCIQNLQLGLFSDCCRWFIQIFHFLLFLLCFVCASKAPVRDRSKILEGLQWCTIGKEKKKCKAWYEFFILWCFFSYSFINFQHSFIAKQHRGMGLTARERRKRIFLIKEKKTTKDIKAKGVGIEVCGLKSIWGSLIGNYIGIERV